MIAKSRLDVGVTAILTVFAISLLLVVFISISTQAAPSDDFAKARPITFTGNSSVMISYPVEVNITWDSDVTHPDYVCFYNNDNTTSYDYWVRDYTVDSHIEYIIETDSSLVWWYYSNTTTSPCSPSGTDTFVAFNDFNDGVVDWYVKELNNAGTVTESDGLLNLVRNSTANLQLTAWYNDSLNYSEYKIHSRVKENVTDDWSGFLVNGMKEQSDDVAKAYQPLSAVELAFYPSVSHLNIMTTDASGAGIWRNDTALSFSSNTFYIWEIRRINNIIELHSDGIGEASYDISEWNHNYTGFFAGNTATGELHADWWFFDEAMAAEPTGSVGDEVTPSGAAADTTPPTMTTQNPVNETDETGSTIDINITVNENADWCGYNFDGGTNQTMLNDSMTNWFLENQTVITNGTTTNLWIWCNDTTGNMGLNSSLWFTYDNQVPATQDLNWTITTTTDWDAGTVDSNSHTYDGNLTMNHSLAFTILDTDMSGFSYGCAAMTSNERVSDDEVFMIFQGITTGANYGTNGTVFYPSNDTFSASIPISYYGQPGTIITQNHPHPRLDYMKSEFVMYYGPYGYFWYKNSTDGTSWGDPDDDKIQIWGAGTQDLEGSQCRWVNDSTCYLCGRYAGADNIQFLKLVIVNVNDTYPNGYWAADMPNETIHTFGGNGFIQSHSSHWNGTDFFCYYRDNAASGNIDYYYGTPETSWTAGTTSLAVDTNGGSFKEDGYYWLTYRTGSANCQIAYSSDAKSFVNSQQIAADCQGLEIRPDRFDRYHYWMSFGRDSTDKIGMMELQRNITGNSTYVTAVNDTGQNNTRWNYVSWNGDTPSGTALTVRLAITNDTGSWGSWETVTNASDVDKMARYGKFQIVMNNTNGDDYRSPTIESLIVQLSDPDTTLPTITLGTPADMNLSTSATVNLTWTGTDDNPLTYYVYIDGVLNASTSNSYLEQTYTDGFHHWFIKADDDTQNSSIIAGWHFGVDTTNPTMTSQTILNTSYATLPTNTITEIKENNVKNVTVQYDGGANHSMTASWQDFSNHLQDYRYVNTSGPTSSDVAWVHNYTGQWDQYAQVVIDGDALWTGGWADTGNGNYRDYATNKTYRVYRQNGSLICTLDSPLGAHPSISSTYSDITYIPAEDSSKGVRAVYDNCTEWWNHTSGYYPKGISREDTTNSLIYYGDLNGTLWAIHINNGTAAWSVNPAGCNSYRGTAPDFDSDKIYSACYTDDKSDMDFLYAHYIANGTEAWSFHITDNNDTGAWDSSPMLIGDLIYIGMYKTTKDNIAAVWKDNGTVAWSADTGMDVVSTIAYNPNNPDFIWMVQGGYGSTTNSGDVYKLYKDNGTTSCMFDYLDNLSPSNWPFMTSSLVISNNGLVYTSSASISPAHIYNASWIFALYEDNCTLSWSKQTGKTAIYDTASMMGRAYTPAALANGQLFTSVDDWFAYAIGTQTVNYTYTTPGLSDGQRYYDIHVTDQNDVITSQRTWFTYSSTTTCNSCSSCSTAIQDASTGDTVQLTADITSATTTCIDFGGNDGITFDCQGYTLSSTNGVGSGIRITGSNDSTIQGCSNISYFTNAINSIVANESGNFTIYNTTIHDTQMSGIGISGDENNLTDVTAHNCGANGVYLAGGGYVLTRVNSSYNDDHGLHLFISTNNTIEDCDFMSNTGDGIYFQGGGWSTVNATTISGSTGSGKYNIEHSASYVNYTNNILSGSNAIRTSSGYNNNLFYNNNITGTNSISSAATSDWNTTKSSDTNILGYAGYGGNYWSGYTGVDRDGDWIGDTSHTLATGNIDNYPLIDPDYATVTATTPDSDQNWSFSTTAGGEELLDIDFASTANVNNTIYFTLHGDLANASVVSINSTTNLTLDDAETVTFNLTINASCPAAAYSGNLTWTSDNDSSQEGNITIEFTISGASADLDILNATWSAAFTAGGSAVRYITINNTGDYNATHCNMTYVSSVGSCSFGSSDFTIEDGEDVQVQATFSGSSTGSDASARIEISCTATVIGGTDSDQVTGSISISADGGASGGGGGTVYYETCGDFWLWPDTHMTGSNKEGEEISWYLNINNGNVSQRFYFELSDEVEDLCEVTGEIAEDTPANGFLQVRVICVAPEGEVSGHLLIKTDTGCESSIAILISEGDFLSVALDTTFGAVTGVSVEDAQPIHWAWFILVFVVIGGVVVYLLKYRD